MIGYPPYFKFNRSQASVNQVSINIEVATINCSIDDKDQVKSQASGVNLYQNQVIKLLNLLNISDSSWVVNHASTSFDLYTSATSSNSYSNMVGIFSCYYFLSIASFSCSLGTTTWILDSSAIDHMVGSLCFFHSYSMINRCSV